MPLLGWSSADRDFPPVSFGFLSRTLHNSRCFWNSAGSWTLSFRLFMLPHSARSPDTGYLSAVSPGHTFSLSSASYRSPVRACTQSRPATASSGGDSLLLLYNEHGSICILLHAPPLTAPPETASISAFYALCG